MTKKDAPAEGDPDRSPERGRCRWCRRVLDRRAGPGRPRRFCSQRCRQWHWVASQREEEIAVSEHELVVARDALDRLHDDLYVLACTVEDIERDLASPQTKQSLLDSLRWLIEVAQPVVDHELHPSPPATTPR